MNKKHPIEIFKPPNVLKAKLGGSGKIDAAVLARAEQAMQALESEFGNWIEEDVEALSIAHARFAAEKSADARSALYRASHDLKGQGKTFGYPFVARVAASLCQLIDALPHRVLPQELVGAHVNAIRVIMRDHVRGNSDMTANVLARELEARVSDATC